MDIKYGGKIKRCHFCKEPIFLGKMWRIGLFPPVAFQHNKCSFFNGHMLLKGINRISAYLFGYNPNKGYHGIDEGRR